MAGNFDGIKTRNFGIEIEMTGLTRCQAAKALSKILGGAVIHEGGTYDKYTVRDSKSRDWSIVYDGSINCYNANGDRASKSYSVEMNSPVLEYEDILLLQEVVRVLRKAGGVTGPRYCAGTHIHISADDYTPQQIRNLVNIFASKEDFLWDALQVSSARESYCHKMDKQFIEEINRKKPKDMEEIKGLWYHGRMSEQFQHYSNRTCAIFFFAQSPSARSVISSGVTSSSFAEEIALRSDRSLNIFVSICKYLHTSLISVF